MKLKRLLSLLIIVVMLSSIIPISASAGVKYGCDKWAEPEMRGANEKGLLTPNAARDFKRALTRDEFCELVVNMSEELLGYELPVPASNPFTDSNSIYVQKAFSYGIVNGVGNNMFDPNGNIERQQIATMMIRALAQLEKDTGKSYLKAGIATMPYADSASIASYAADSVRIAYSNGIMHGDEAKRFNPTFNINSQECVAVIYRCYTSFDDVLHHGFSNDRMIEKAVKNLRIGYSFGENSRGVSSDIDLPTSGIGGVSVTWSSSNESVISSKGIVKPGSYATNVTLTATLRLGNLTRTKTFTLTVSPLAFDRLQLENALEILDIYYCVKGDSADRVTGRICLPGHSNGLSVKWSTSNEAVVSTRGYVNPPKDDSVISVTLTATITKADQVKIKTFLLKIVNPARTANLSLHKIALDMTQYQVANELGSPKRTITMSSTESWQLFHSSYSSFIAVGYISGKVVSVYSMSSNASSQFRNTDTNTSVTLEQAKTYGGVGLKVYTDTNDSDRIYAIMLYDNKSNITAYRTLSADGTEQLLSEIINAFRAQKSIAALTFNTKLASAARAHSNDMSQYNYFDRTGRDNSTYLTRAVRAGYDSGISGEENIAANCADAVDFLNSWVNAKTQRANLLNTSYTAAGIGYAPGTNYSTYKNYCTIDLSALRPVASVATNPTPILLATSEQRNVVLTVSPSTYNETFTVSSSNTNVFTVTRSGSSLTVTLKGGSSRNDANLVITGNSSGNVINIPVSVGTTYATALNLNYTNLLMDMSSSVQITASTTPSSGPVVTWTTNNSAVAQVSANGVVTAGTTAGTAVITATVRKSATENITKTVNVRVVSVALTPSATQTISLDSGSQTLSIGATVNTATGTSVTWSSSNTTAATVSPASGSSTVVTAKAAGSTVVTCTVTVNGYSGSVVKTVAVNVSGQAEYATNIELSPSSLMLGVGQKQTIIATTTPTSVKYGTITWSSGDSSVATVSPSGEITAVGIGTTTISAKLPSGPNEQYFERTVTVTVVGIEITAGSTTIAIGEAPMQFGLTTTPNPTPSPVVVNWFSSSVNYAIIDDSGNLTPVAAGEVKIWAEIISLGIKSNEIIITVTAASEGG